MRIVLALALVIVSLGVVTVRAGGEPPAGPTVLITGANRGLGLEFARQLSARGWRVIGTARKPGEADDLRTLGVRIEQLDVADARSVQRLAEAVGDAPLDVLINNAGIGGGYGETLGQVDIERVERVLQVNCLGPIRVTQALLPALKRGGRKLIVNISSGLGSIERNTRGGAYGYRESKAALNMFTRSLAAELKADGFTCIAQSPGWVKTDMGGPNASLTPEQSIGAMLQVFEGLSPEDTGSFYGHGGDVIPW